MAIKTEEHLADCLAINGWNSVNQYVTRGGEKLLKGSDTRRLAICGWNNKMTMDAYTSFY